MCFFLYTLRIEGHVGWSSQLQRSVRGFKLAFRLAVMVKDRVRSWGMYVYEGPFKDRSTNVCVCVCKGWGGCLVPMCLCLVFPTETHQGFLHEQVMAAWRLHGGVVVGGGQQQDPQMVSQLSCCFSNIPCQPTQT